MKRNIHRKQIMNFLMLLLCTSLLTGTSFAKETEIMELDREGLNLLHYGCTLTDGRILLHGYRANGEKSAARLLCLNGDRTVSWDYTDGTADGGLFTDAAELQDGTIGVCFRRDGYMSLRFFTQDGKTARAEIVIPNKGSDTHVANVTGSRLQLIHEDRVPTGEGFRVENPEVHLIDWDGNEIAELDDYTMLFSGDPMIEEDDALVMGGYNESGTFFMKTDLSGNVIWKKTLSCVCPETDFVTPEIIIRTGDGGYLAVQAEQIPTSGVFAKYRNVLMKLDGDGNILWTNSEIFAGTTDLIGDVTAFGGKLAACFTHFGEDYRSYGIDRPRTIIWFDENGTGLGTAELSMSPEVNEMLEQYIREQTDRSELMPVGFGGSMVAMQDGLWMPDLICLVERDTGIPVPDSYAAVLFKVPEP